MSTSMKNSQSSSGISKLPASPISPLETKNQQLETFQLVWLDPHVHTDAGNKATYKILQDISTHILTFTDCSTCEEWLKNYFGKEKIIFIVSGRYGKKILPKIHNLQSIVAIYVFCVKRARHEKWARNYRKVCSIVTATQDLTRQLLQNRKNLESIEDSKAIQIFHDHYADNNLNVKNAPFIWYHLLLEILISSSYLSSRSTFAQLVEILRQSCMDNPHQMISIEQFATTYDAKQAISWLMHDTPVIRFINKTLREQDISNLFLLRFFLNDVHFRLTTHATRVLHVYRLQPFSLEEIQYLKTNQNGYLLFNGFLWTSTNKPNLESITHDNNQYQTVLIEIDADPDTNGTPFVHIDELNISNENPHSNNVLFMCGSIFQIVVLKSLDKSLWTIQLKLVGEKDLTILTQMKRQLRQHADLSIVGDLLEKCGQYDKAIIYYKCLFRELSSHHVLIPKIKEKLNKLVKLKSTSLTDTQIVLVDLSTRLSKLALCMLDALQQLTNETILIFDKEFNVNLQQFGDKTILLFTSSQFITTMKTTSEKNLIIFILEKDDTKVNQRDRFSTGEDLICQLADEMYRCYTKDAMKHFQWGDIKIAKEKENLANQIHNKLREVHEKMIITTTNSNSQSLSCVKTELVWLKHIDQNDIKVDQLEKEFVELVSSFSSFNNVHNCQNYLSKDNDHIIFLIIDTKYDDSIISVFKHSNNIKRLYRCGHSVSETDKTVITNLDDLRYQLTYDLIAHYSDLGAEHRANNETEQARNMFSKAKKLCDFLAEF